MAAISSLRFRPRTTPVNSPAGQKRLFLDVADGLLKTVDDAGNVVAVADGTGLPDAPSDGTQYARKDGAWVEVVAGSAAPTALAPAANVLFGVVAGAGVTVLPASPAFGAKAEYVITPTGADRNLKITTAILKPSNSSYDRAVGVTLPVGKPSIVMFKCVDEAGTWMLISNVGGGE